MATGAFSHNIGKLFSELKLVTDNLFIIYIVSSNTELPVWNVWNVWNGWKLDYKPTSVRITFSILYKRIPDSWWFFTHIWCVLTKTIVSLFTCLHVYMFTCLHVADVYMLQMFTCMLQMCCSSLIRLAVFCSREKRS